MQTGVFLAAARASRVLLSATDYSVYAGQRGSVALTVS